MGPLGDMGWADHQLMRIFPALYSIPASPLRWTLLLITLFIALWAGRTIYLAAIRALLHATTNMNTLVSLGTSVALIYSAFSTVFPAPGRAVYFDAVLLILGFLLAGKSLEARAKRRALDALNALSSARPNTARRVGPDGSTTIIPLADLKPDDSVLILPGERFPVDGTILTGTTTVDESMLSGESTPLAKTTGGKVLAGSLNYDGAVTCRAESLGETTVLARIEQLVQQAQSSRTPMEGLADRVSSIFVPVVLIIAAATFLIWIFATHNLSMALANSVAVLVIACPCAMGLAVPAALTVAVGRGAQLGLLYKGGEALERLTTLDTLVLDKTGTITVGRPVLTAIHNLSNLSDEKILSLAASAEERTNHPLAHAIIDAAKARSLAWPAAESIQVIPGRGLTARIDGKACLLGNIEIMTEYGIKPASLPNAPTGVTRLYMALDNQLVAVFDSQDQLRPGVAALTRNLTHLGLSLYILTGDSASAAEPIASEAGITNVEAGLDPLGKLTRIRQMQQQGHKVGMAGDGINDAAALAQADAGIAMGTGADLAQEAGDVLLLRSDPALISHSITLARATLSIMRQNLLWAAVYNLLGIPLAAGALYPAFHILLSPWLASVAMAFSSISVLANSLRLRKWLPPVIT
jgi:Cu+-exporting ATPase